MRVWVTRAEPGASATAGRLVGLGHAPLVAPVIALAPIAPAALDLEGVGAIAFTSANAVEAFAALGAERGWPVFAVGEATAQAARAAGFAYVESADGDVAALAALIVRRRGEIEGAVLHPGAKAPAGDLVGALATTGVAVRQVALYEARAAHALPEAAAKALKAGGLDAVLIHSPSAARVLAALLTRAGAAGLAAFALSEACAEPLAGAGFARLEAAPFPREEALLKLLA